MIVAVSDSRSASFFPFRDLHFIDVSDSTNLTLGADVTPFCAGMEGGGVSSASSSASEADVKIDSDEAMAALLKGLSVEFRGENTARQRVAARALSSMLKSRHLQDRSEFECLMRYLRPS